MFASAGRGHVFRSRWALAVGLAVSPAFGATAAPDWLAAVARAPVTVAAKEADAIRLLEEDVVEIGRDGERLTRTRQVFKILNVDGKKFANARVGYHSGSSEVKSFKAWVIQPDGKVRAYGRKETADLAVNTGAMELYGEARRQGIGAADDAGPGAVFGYESVVEARSVFNQITWAFQGELPTERSTLTVKLAPGWTLTGRTFNHAPIPATAGAGTHTWTLTGLAGYAKEPMSPPARGYAPWLAVDLLPPAHTPGSRAGIKVGSWPELSRYFTPKYDAAAAPDAALRQRVAQLLAGATDDWDRLQRLCRFAQRVNYISIQLDHANAGGMIPRPAHRVLQCNYGDCKDKATMLRALLAAAGIVAHPLIVLSGSRDHIEADWPSPVQFNHCILAIAVDASVPSAAILAHPQLGRLLVFDPTDEYTPLGLLARHRLARQALLLAGDAGGLVELPPARAEGDKLVRTITAELDAVGNLRADLVEDFSGVASSTARAEFERRNKEAFKKQIERWLNGTLPALRDTQVEATDRFPVPEFQLSVSFLSFGYGKLMRDELLVFKPALVARRDAVRFTKKTRTLPVVLRAGAYEEHATFLPPRGYIVDELPRPVRLETDFGRYRAEAKFADGKIVFERALEQQSGEIPAADYEKVRVFFEKIQQSEQSPIVLRRVAGPPPVEKAEPKTPPAGSK